MLEKSQKCQMCGTADWEWDPEQGGNKFAYEAIENLCQGCLRTATLNENVGSKPGVTVILSPTNTVEHLQRQKRQERQWHEDMLRRAGRDSAQQL